jgi:hypothetical protein
LAPSPPYASVPDYDAELSIESTERRLLEIRLMHHFVTSTVNEGFLSAHDEAISELWAKHAPIEALKYPFLMNVILSIAALHITKINPSEHNMAKVHRTYFNAAISGHLQAVRDIGPDNAEPLLISAILIGLPAFTLLQDTDVASYSPPLQLFRLQGGNSPLFGLGLPMLSKTSKVRSLLTAKPHMQEFRREVDNEIYLQPFLQLMNWRAPGEVVDPESQAAYELVLKFVGCVFSNIEKGEDSSILRRMMTSLAAWLPLNYINLLKERNPRALVILAHYFSLAKAMDNVWWMRGISEREVFGIQTILPEQWQWAMAWPLQRLISYAAPPVPPQ